MWTWNPSTPSWTPLGDLCVSLCLSFPSLNWGADSTQPMGSSCGCSSGGWWERAQSRAGLGGPWGGACSEQLWDPPPAGAPADTAGGEAAHDGHGAAGGALRRHPGALQRPQCLPVQTGASGAPSWTGGGVGRTAGRARLPPRVPPAGLLRASLSPGSRAHAGGGEGWRVPGAVGALWTWSLLCLPS